MHFCVDRHSLSLVQLGLGRVSTTHAPWSQYWPVEHCESAVHDATHAPATQKGSPPVQSALLLHVDPGLGTHAPFVQEDPVGHDTKGGTVLHVGRHFPSSHTSVRAH